MRQFNSIAIEQYNNKKGVTLIELLIAICIFSLIVIGFSSIDTFSRYHVITSDRRAKLQNDASYVLEHMVKEMGKAIGNRAIIAEDPIDLANIGGDTAITAYVDLAADGQSPGDGKRGTGGDRWRAYRFCNSSFPPANRYQIWYYPDYVTPSSSYEILSRSITDFTRSVIDNHVYVNITACWDPDRSPAECGTPDNPAVSMKNRIYMPAVSTN